MNSVYFVQVLLLKQNGYELCYKGESTRSGEDAGEDVPFVWN